MGERYWITGVQLGMIKAIATADPQMEETMNRVVEDIEGNQFIGNLQTDEDKDIFLKFIKDNFK